MAKIDEAGVQGMAMGKVFKDNVRTPASLRLFLLIKIDNYWAPLPPRPQDRANQFVGFLQDGRTPRHSQ